jgi:hypothetical protein
MEAIEQAPDEREFADWDLDYRRQLLHWAMEAVRPDFSEQIWQAFTGVSLENRDPIEVADELGMSRNAVYIAKCRVIRRLGKQIHSIAGEQWEIDAAEKNS